VIVLIVLLSFCRFNYYI